ncbi:MAG: sigma-70 family RNA polymerase sigma factor [Paludisphaera borealis]|uniref:sigma-70 family RNA polymerase sigma factor n=1 Tax=Paludisphaera borealis TaxID=1387353 RepID=UPI00283E5C85|nr:sigma-70 family RNA polymerase sigma factor [Paludisphaera borealis]MDR3619507.1 sigma-70 family RNA polymerase sigma factor [Paludisphaera borealis]
MRRLRNAPGDLRTVYEGGVVAGMTDAQLLERFARGDGEGATSAFSVLVERHGPMVMGACRASLGNEHDAEDAFQAVFLVLARKAESVWVRDSLGPWLHAVAVRTSAHLRVQVERRKRHERRFAESSNGEGDLGWIDDDLARTIHEEVGRLPDRFREAVVLCDLEGCSHEEAAGRLGWPIGTVKSRQARGRERLRERLSRRGLAPAEFAVAAALSSSPVSAASIHATVRAATVFRAGRGATAGAVSAASALAKAVSGAMTMSVLKSSVLAVLACGAVVAGGLSISRGMPAQDARSSPDGPPAVVAPSGSRPPAGSLLAMQVAADPKHDGEAPGPLYRWAKVDPKAKLPLDGLVVRNEAGDSRIALKPGPQNLTERDLIEVKRIEVERGQPAVFIRMTPDGSRRLGELTRSHLPEDGGVFKYRLALIVEGVVVGLPMIHAEIRDAAVIELGPQSPPEEVDRIVKLLAGAAAYNTPSTARAVKNRAEAVREAKDVDLPALEKADRIAIDSLANGSRMSVSNARSSREFVRALKPGGRPVDDGKPAATLWFYRGDKLLRKVWVREGGEWGFERPGASWTTGADSELWRLVDQRLPKSLPISTTPLAPMPFPIP